MHCVDGEFDVKVAHACCNTFAFICTFVVGSLEVMEEQCHPGQWTGIYFSGRDVFGSIYRVRLAGANLGTALLSGSDLGQERAYSILGCSAQ